MSEPAADVQALLRTLVEQQTALLSVHAENIRLQRLLVDQLVNAPASSEAAPTAETVAPPETPSPTERPALRVVGGTASRGERYYQGSSASPSSARPVSSAELDTLRRIQAAGEVAQLILTFGPHAGETLGQVARGDPDYLRRLALNAQRPDVRAAAARLVGALPAPAPVDRRTNRQRSRHGTWRGAP